MGIATKETWDQVAVGSRVRWRGRDYTITSEKVDDNGFIRRHIVPDQPIKGEFANGEFDIAGYPDDPVGWDIRPPEGARQVDEVSKTDGSASDSTRRSRRCGRPS